MAGKLLDALTRPLTNHIPNPGFTFQHRLHHDFKSLIWVIVYAMTVHDRNTLATTDLETCKLYKEVLDSFWAVHSYRHVAASHNDMLMQGALPDSLHMGPVNHWLPDPLEAAFFHDAMLMITKQRLYNEHITYASICKLFNDHIQLAKERQQQPVASN